MGGWHWLARLARDCCPAFDASGSLIVKLKPASPQTTPIAAHHVGDTSPAKSRTRSMT